MRTYKICLYLSAFIVFFISCKTGEMKLPVLGQKLDKAGNTVTHLIPDFEFSNHENQIVNNKTFKDKVYVAHFFFTTCPTICPITTRQMLRIYDKYKEDDRVLMLSHTLDPKKDTIGALKNYADNIDVGLPKWHFVTGKKKELRDICTDYMNIVVDDPDAPGGINHSGKLILVDHNRQIRSFCEGTDPDEVTRFLEDIDILLKEYKVEVLE